MSFSIDANSALSSALMGMQSSSRVLDRAANNIAKTSVSASERASFSSNATLESATQGVKETASYTPPMAQSILDTMVSSTLYTANARVVEAADATVGAALNILV